MQIDPGEKDSVLFSLFKTKVERDKDRYIVKDGQLGSNLHWLVSQTVIPSFYHQLKTYSPQLNQEEKHT